MNIIYNGNIYLSQNNFCEALLINGGQIAKTGSAKEILEIAPLKAEKIDAQGALVLPAFHDSHLHLMWTGRRESGIECAGAKSVQEVIARGREKIALLKPAKGTYIRGSGLDPDFFTNGQKRDPVREDLDKITAEHPLIISRRCGHVIYCNSKALELAGISGSFPEIKGGTVEKDGNGRPTGVLKENASLFAQNKMPALTLQERKTHIRLAMKKAHSLGITSCGSYDVDGPDFDDIVRAYRQVYEEYQNENIPGLKVGLQCGISLSDEILDKHLARKKCGPLWQDKTGRILLFIQSVKLFADGTLGGHTAFMRQPYSDNPSTQGFPLIEQDVLDYFVQKADRGQIQVLVHAIGDAGMDMAIKSFEKVTGKTGSLANTPGKNPLHHGIIHCQVTTPDLLERMAHNEILAIVQPGFLEDDMHILESRVGAGKASTSYAWASMLKLKVPVFFSTDAPVSSLNPLHCIEWAVSRGGFNPLEKVGICSCVDAYTSPVKPGAPADLVFLDKDIFSIDPAEFSKVKVLRTMAYGVTVFENM